MTPTKLLQLIRQDEGQQIEFKLESEKQADLAEVMMGFANAEGGHLFVGVTDDGEAVGVVNVKTIVDRLHSAARRINPPLHGIVTVDQVPLDDKIIVVAHIPADLQSTYSVSGRFRIREGSFSRLMSSADVVAHAVQRGTLNYEQTPVRQTTLNDLSEQKIKDFLTQRLRVSVPDQSIDQLLETMGAVVMAEENKPIPTVAGVLFFGNWPQFHLSHTTILAARIVGPIGTQIIDRATIEGTLPEMIDRAVQFVRRNTRHGLKIGQPGTARALEVDEYPMDAVREAITNACCHRDYLERSPIQLKIYDNRIVIGNPGGLLPGLDINHLEGKHKARNPRLADWLQALGYVERFGIGVMRMREAMIQSKLPMPIFQNRFDWFEVTLQGPGESFMKERTDQTEASIHNTTPHLPTIGEQQSQPWYTQRWSVVRMG